MWENAAKHTDTPPAPPAAAEPGEYDTLLWAQIILCVLIAAGVFAARALELPLYSTLRTDYRYALAQPGPDFWNTDGWQINSNLGILFHFKIQAPKHSCVN